ncbi:undecaprenyldiphospho-muramoylpentapeptide beta-N-acetylglucosaminyltransferase [Campylobacter sp. US33a]|uniref:undecaprenyldiphospho-muramoylpentapeptide beta-N-acetylglucosaminyltransferase n=1 Tax=Campylobacter sp. US33a TaxID=2498120 RepID=UPI0010672C69|nr:undecaprenyldiphospho-muramoylpentapeptide beta-N-acetylglucosaminyltransferase [Campylobacter sp. US33a]MCW1359816.1 undecaprenyldiphospho-muramoylpentapeptide beta-N-acetylglucosaminyltransferase [Campylobacter jejuni]TEY03082.1 undecaprenyldiphospho-muramoylpentapeptide beta-N-acetylglucosaminyltransferase [Campylobacter sp. US33a]
MKIAITGGGTGGHLSIAKCILESAKKRNLECIYIGSQNGQDKAWFENEDKFEAKYFLSSSGVVNKKGFGKLKSFIHILKLSFECKKILRQHNIQAVFSVGGYSSAPAAFGAIFSRTPLFIHEQNSKKGSLNSLLKPFSKKFFSAFENTFCPYPVDEKFFNSARKRSELKSIIFLGGSQGANFINQLALKLACELNAKGISIIHQCGKNDYELCKKEYEKLNIQVDLFAFDNHLELKMQKADLAISRAGASTLFELCANTLPALFIPFAYAAKNHQYFNAKFLQDKALCQIFTQEQAKNENAVLKAILAMNLEDISSRLKDIVQKNGADFMLQEVL